MKNRDAILARLNDEATEINDATLHDQYDDSLDSCCEEVKIGNLRYSPSQVLKAVDPTAYRCGFVDWLDSESERVVDIDGTYWDRESVVDALDDWESELEDEIASEQEEGGDTAKEEELLEEVKTFRKTRLG